VATLVYRGRGNDDRIIRPIAGIFSQSFQQFIAHLAKTRLCVVIPVTVGMMSFAGLLKASFHDRLGDSDCEDKYWRASSVPEGLGPRSLTAVCRPLFRTGHPGGFGSLMPSNLAAQ
jgi:hypothetical protein